MDRSRRILIAGESWVTHSVHQKGFDSFTTTAYTEGVGPLRDALVAGGYTVDYQPAHVAARAFPETAEALGAYGAVILSDIGANTLLLHPETFERSIPHADRLVAIRDYVYEQITLGADFLEGQSDYLLPNMEVEINFHNERAIGIQLPTSVVLEVVETEPGIKNATATTSFKPAKLETGITVQVPPFVSTGEKIRVSTDDGSYIERA